MGADNSMMTLRTMQVKDYAIAVPPPTTLRMRLNFEGRAMSDIEGG